MSDRFWAVFEAVLLYEIGSWPTVLLYFSRTFRGKISFFLPRVVIFRSSALLGVLYLIHATFAHSCCAKRCFHSFDKLLVPKKSLRLLELTSRYYTRADGPGGSQALWRMWLKPPPMVKTHESLVMQRFPLDSARALSPAIFAKR
ncbi:hypothetical protein DFH08DRAFT_176747 [Mycena albidolilacea]|uniref:Uncharacterized protein n=1 Tax=Mycena albidolilacea TaxID=1033008 RepID=A0AAD7ARV6_9AGAR|nr:hypothetical protein DFH08DRAFT_176747 [Mycena albidolilacea]